MYELWLFLIVIAVLFTCLAGSIDSLIIFCVALFIVVALLGFIMSIGVNIPA
jgi:DHA1 family bicyclomycin/chloramphenicol resistance-like MFS transporter